MGIGGSIGIIRAARAEHFASGEQLRMDLKANHDLKLSIN